MEGKSKEIGEGNSETPVAEWATGMGREILGFPLHLTGVVLLIHPDAV